MAQRHEVEAWVKPAAWGDQDEAQRVVEEILASGSDDEAEWTRIAFPEPGNPQQEAVLAAAARDYDRAGETLNAARDALHAAVRVSVRRGMPVQDVTRVSGLSRAMVYRIAGAR